MRLNRIRLKNIDYITYFGNVLRIINKSQDLLEQTLKHFNTDQFLDEYRKN